jgi:ribose transport system ATP-binding protein
MLLDGRDFSPRTVKQAMKAGIALVPEDRSRDAAFADFTVSQNLSVAVLPRLRRRGRLDGALARRFAVDLIGRFRIKVAGPDALFASMSGGNQQKTILARWMQRDPRLLLLDEPTQGVDAMSRAEIYDVIRESARNDNAAVIVSSDLGELHALCDRIVVVSDGRIVREVAAAETSVDELAAAVLSSPKTEERSAA